ncbi:MAG: hypothetical protein RIT04_227 [Candidatus Parcubacteria bacterium]|jgi:cyclopropane-fatty-acyl-phospholipid synthase
MNYIKVLDEIFSQFDGPRFGVKFWNNETKYYGDAGSVHFVLIINKPSVIRRILAEGALGFGESFMDGGLEIEGDIEGYLKLRHQFRHVQPSFRLVVAKLLATLTTPWTRKKQIAYHYDLGTDFFSLFLDRSTMSYSAGSFLHEDDSLDAAQQSKLKMICDWLGINDGSNILDIGSGWGGFAVYAAKKHKHQIKGCALSQKQIEYARSEVLNKQINNVSFEYCDVTKDLPPGDYDAAVMIEAIEHVGQAGLGNFLCSVHQTIHPGAPFYLQFTGRYKPKQVDQWTLKYVFPGGHLPSKDEFLKAVEQSGFVVERFEDHTEDYKKTMRLWINAIEARQTEIEEMFDSKFFRLWKLWTHGAYVNFEIGDMSLFRVLLRKP